MTASQTKAAKLFAQTKSSAAVAKAVKVTERTLRTWRRNPEFLKAINDAREASRARAQEEGDLTQRAYRLEKLQRQYDLIWEAIVQRAESEQMAGIPAGRTGMVTVTYKMQAIGGGATEKVPEYEIDTGTSAELRAILQHAATEVGDWRIRSVVEKHKTMDATPAAIALAMVMSTEELEALAAKMALAQGVPPA